jgi:cell division protein FtsN
MENRNILLVIASISFFLVVVVGVGLWLFWPKGEGEEGEMAASADTLFDEQFDSFEFYRGRDEIPGLLKEAEETPGEAPAEKEEIPAAEETPGEPGTEIVFGEREKVPREEVIIESKAIEPSPKKTVAPTAEKEETTPPKAAAETQKTVSAPKAPAPKPAEPKQITKKEYEIQVGSFKTRSGAEAVNDQLKALGMPGSIRTREVRGDTYFRVRIGPYENKEEAQKFLGWIKDIKGFEESYVSQVTRTVTLN